MEPRVDRAWMNADVRHRALRLISTARPHDILLCREVESQCHAAATTAREYTDRVRHAAFNMSQDERLGLEVVHASDRVLTQHTLVGRIHRETRARQERFQAMLQEKCDALNDQTFEAIVRCRRCGSEEVTWEEKQTRSADEGFTIFCFCVTCKNRWVKRQ